MTVDDIEKIIAHARYLVVNEHEFSLFQKISGLSQEAVIASFEKVVVTF
jgi:sugar/nucleoside kinase (ribokinase family)